MHSYFFVWWCGGGEGVGFSLDRSVSPRLTSFLDSNPGGCFYFPQCFFSTVQGKIIILNG